MLHSAYTQCLSMMPPSVATTEWRTGKRDRWLRSEACQEYSDKNGQGVMGWPLNVRRGGLRGNNTLYFGYLCIRNYLTFHHIMVPESSATCHLLNTKGARVPLPYAPTQFNSCVYCDSKYCEITILPFLPYIFSFVRKRICQQYFDSPFFSFKTQVKPHIFS